MSTVYHEQQKSVPPPTAVDASEGRVRSLAGKILHVGPTALVFVALGGFAAWGHFSDWQLPSFASLTGHTPPELPAWCTDHNVPADQCLECRPELLAKAASHGWCKRHGVMDCPLEHPEVAQLKSTPTVSSAMLEQADRALQTRPRPENNSRCLLHERRIQLASTDAVEKLGIDIALVQERPIVEAITANGEITYDQTQTARLASRVPGTAMIVLKQVGDRVAKEEVVALIDAAEVGRAKSAFLQAISQLRLQQSNVSRLRPLENEGVVAGKQIRESEAALEAAKIALQASQQTLINLGLPVRWEEVQDLGVDELSSHLRLLGIPSSLASGLDPTTTTSNLLPIRSPLGGIVTERKVVAGETVTADAPLFEVADVERLWLTLNVRQEDSPYVSIGQKVLFRPSDAAGDSKIEGTINWISTAADDQTRTISVRAELPNVDGRLRANTFGLGRIVLRQEAAAMTIPTEAVHWDGTCHVVFVRDKNYFEPGAYKFFHVRAVRVGEKENDVTEIIAGLMPGEVVASKNSMVLEAQLLKSNLGAGCCEVHAAKK